MHGGTAEAEQSEKHAFDAADLGKVERLLQKRVNSDPVDLRATFRYGVLASFRDDFFSAGRSFSKVATANWNRSITRNNLAVVYFRSGFTRAAVDMLLELAQSKQAPPAVFFNLAVICDGVAAYGEEVPEDLIECGLLSEEVRPEQRAIEFFARSLASSRPWRGGLAGALYLWPEDVPAGFGFSINLGQPNTEEANFHLYEGIACMRRRQWDEALKHFDIVSSAPDAGKAAVNARREAILGMCRQLRDDIALKLEESSYPEAEALINKLAALSAELPVEDLLRRLLFEELAAIGTRLEKREPVVDFVILQTFSRSIQNAVAKFAGLGAVGDPNEKRPGGSAVDDPLAHVRLKCAQAVEDLLRRIIRMGRYDAATQLLGWAQQQWLASALQGGWDREIHHAKALDYWSRAKDVLSVGATAEGTQHLGTALVAAHDAGDKGLIQIIEYELASLNRTEAQADTVKLIKKTMAERRYVDAARLCADAVKNNPSNEGLVALSTQALQQLCNHAHALARVSQWAEAVQLIDHYLEYRPEDRDAQSFRVSMIGRFNDELIENAWNRWQSREPLSAQTLPAEIAGICDRVLGLDPAHARALELLREIAATESRVRAEAADDSADRRYRQSLARFEQAMARGPAEEALSCLHQLRALRPDERHTKQATDRVLALCISQFRTRLEVERDASALDVVEHALLQLRNISPEFIPAAELLEKVGRLRVREDAGRRAIVERKLVEANEKLTRMAPAPAMQELESVLVLDLPETRARASALRERAIVMGQRRLEMLMHDGAGEHVAERDELTCLLERWAPHLLRDILTRRTRVRDEASRADTLRRELEHIADEARSSSAPTVTALSDMERALRRLRRRYGELPASGLARVRDVRRDILTAADPWSRWVYRARSFLTGAWSLYAAGSPA
jgi:tetratricopeptide (TPR) repeat protein